MQSVSRIFLVIEKIAESQSGMGITELSKATSLPKSTIHRTVNALINSNYLIKDDKDKYRLGYKFIAIAKKYITGLDLREVAGPFLHNLVRKLNVAGHIAVRRGDYAVYVEKIQPYSYVCMYSEIGKSIELYCSALGKSLMLGMTDKELNNYIDTIKIYQYTPNTLNKEKLIEEIEKAKVTGITIDNSEHESHVYCMAAPIYDHAKSVVGAISITSADENFLQNSEAIELLKQAGRDISKQYGR